MEDVWGEPDEPGKRQRRAGIWDVFFGDTVPRDDEDGRIGPVRLRPRKISVYCLLAAVFEPNLAVLDGWVVQYAGFRSFSLFVLLSQPLHGICRKTGDRC